MPALMTGSCRCSRRRRSTDRRSPAAAWDNTARPTATDIRCKWAAFFRGEFHAPSPAAHVVQRLLLDIGQDVVDPSARLAPVVPAVGVARPGISPAAGGKPPGGLFVLQAAQGELLEVVLALHLPGRLAGRLHRRQQQRNQNADDRNDHQKFHQRKTRRLHDLHDF